MAVAPLNKVQEVLNYAVTQIDRNKIFMGIPNYGYNWTLPFVQGTSQAQSLSNVQAVELAGDVGAYIQYDPVAQAPHFNYFDNQWREHEVWFEDARSIRAKLVYMVLMSDEIIKLPLTMWRYRSRKWLRNVTR